MSHGQHERHEQRDVRICGKNRLAPLLSPLVNNFPGFLRTCFRIQIVVIPEFFPVFFQVEQKTFQSCFAGGAGGNAEIGGDRLPFRIVEPVCIVVVCRGIPEIVGETSERNFFQPGNFFFKMRIFQWTTAPQILKSEQILFFPLYLFPANPDGQAVHRSSPVHFLNMLFQIINCRIAPGKVYYFRRGGSGQCSHQHDCRSQHFFHFHDTAPFLLWFILDSRQ